MPETSLALDPCECKNGGGTVGVPDQSPAGHAGQDGGPHGADEQRRDTAMGWTAGAQAGGTPRFVPGNDEGPAPARGAGPLSGSGTTLGRAVPVRA